jgi:hypothetical protein
VRVTHRLSCAWEVEVQACEGACIGAAPKADIYAIGAVIHGSFQGWQTACGTNQFKRHV